MQTLVFASHQAPPWAARCPQADDPSSWELRKLACSVSSSIVGISCYGLGFRPYHSSGIILEHNGEKFILTSCYILGDRSKTPSKVTIFLCNKQGVDADITHINVDHNIVLLRAKQQQELDETTTARFITDLRKSGTLVSSVGRDYHYRLMASSGTTNVRGDHLECDDLMSSSCNISEWGIGGPLVDRSGNVLGMNFFSKKGYTPFMPSNIIMKCVKHLIEIGYVSRPWLGLRTRSLEELDIDEFEAIYLKFQSTNGLVVKEV
ncbi:putative protease Do-like 14 [Silene latifolia]|uniref:putative protease Do-like 14 n=1 Tax=Silene latifolia TaxID=37657 RepID=UPI003D775319